MAVTDVRVGSTGTCEIAPEGTTLPTNAGSALEGAFVDLGEISEEGLEHAFDVSSEQIRNWSGKVLRSVNTDTTATFKLQFMETTADVLELFYGATVESQLGDYSRVLITSPDTTPQAMVITVVDSADDSFKRYVLPRIVVSERGEVKDVNSDASYWECTVTALYDSTISGFGYLQIDNDLTS
jgi:hypothetical protein